MSAKTEYRCGAARLAWFAALASSGAPVPPSLHEWSNGWADQFGQVWVRADAPAAPTGDSHE